MKNQIDLRFNNQLGVTDQNSNAEHVIPQDPLAELREAAMDLLASVDNIIADQRAQGPHEPGVHHEKLENEEPVNQNVAHIAARAGEAAAQQAEHDQQEAVATMNPNRHLEGNQADEVNENAGNVVVLG